MFSRFVFSVFAIILLTNSFIIGQQSGNSPYSRLGIGDLNDNNFNHLRQMSGLGASYIDGHHMNIVNPASYSFLNATVFDFGVFAKKTWLKDDVNSNTFWSGNLDYIALAFPLKNPINEIYDGKRSDYKWGMSFALMPHSFVSYDIAVTDSINALNPFTHNYKGSGGTYKVLWGNSLKYKNISFGINLGYLLGNIKYENNVIFDYSDFALNNKFSNFYSIKGFLWNAGLLYFITLNKKEIEKNKIANVKRLSLGIHGNSNTNFTTSYNVFNSQTQNLPTGTIVDTITLKSDLSGKGKLPAEFGIGATYYYGEKFAFGMNFNTTYWSSYYNQAVDNIRATLSNTFKVSIGGFYRPDYKSFDKFFERVYYRYGFYYNTDPRSINGKQIDAYGVTLGLGMPFVFQRKVSHINLGLNAGVRGQNTPISEKFVKISLGVTFNDDEWFLKRKYN